MNQNKEIVENMNWQAWLENALIDAFLKGKGYTRESLKEMNKKDAKSILVEASTYASTKMAEIEGRAILITEIHDAFKQ